MGGVVMRLACARTVQCAHHCTLTLAYLPLLCSDEAGCIVAAEDSQSKSKSKIKTGPARRGAAKSAKRGERGAEEEEGGGAARESVS